MKIFAYGSNMSLNRLKARVPSAKKVAIGYIEGYQLKCIKKSNDGSGKATVLEMNDDNVWGVVFEIDEKEKPSLDRAEGLNYGYNEFVVEVKLEKEICKAQIYIADRDAVDEKRIPYNWYKAFILNGAESNKLPEGYINKLKEIASYRDENDERRTKNENILKGK